MIEWKRFWRIIQWWVSPVEKKIDMKKTHIIIHHSLTADGTCVNTSAIRRYHVETLGWAAIGYHYLLEDINGDFEVLLGRWVDEIGAHCKDMKMNFRGIGICFVGNYDEQVPVLGLWRKGVELVKRLVMIHDIPIENILGHREVQVMAGIPPEERKSCPGKTFSMDKFRDDVRAAF